MLEIIEIKGIGFKPLKDYKSWRIALSAFDEKNNSFDGVKTFSRHLETEEVFVLLQGEGYLFTASGEERLEEIHVIKMEKNKLYTVKERQWHATVFKPGTLVLIVENQDTGDHNSNSYLITEEDKEKMKLLMEKADAKINAHVSKYQLPVNS